MNVRTASHLHVKRQHGFTLVELLVVIAIVAILASILLPALAKSRARAQGVFCFNNARQLTVAWVLYSEDNNGRLAYNFGSSTMTIASSSGPGRVAATGGGGSWGSSGASPSSGASGSMALNWVNNVLNWELSPDNTNTTQLVATGIGPYTGRAVNVYRCPSDHAVSAIQAAAGWYGRVRSYSMNAMIGDAGTYTHSGYNLNNPEYVQFFTAASIRRPSEIFVFLDEHPDSINDGYFLVREPEESAYQWGQWTELPASYHDGAASFSFADGHATMKKWRNAKTKAPAQPDIGLPIKVSASEAQDFYWVLSKMSVEREAEHHP